MTKSEREQLTRIYNPKEFIINCRAHELPEKFLTIIQIEEASNGKSKKS